MKEVNQLTSEEERSLTYCNYPTRPRLIDAKTAIEKGIIRFGQKNIIYRPQDQDAEELQASRIEINKRRNFRSLIEATIFGLNEAVVKVNGLDLREALGREMDLIESLKKDYRKYGTYVYYPNTGDLTQFTPKNWHRLSLVTSNNLLLSDPDRKMDWNEIRNKFDNFVPAIAGASVGSNIALALSMDLRPETIKIADPNNHKVSNGNRKPLSYGKIVQSQNELDLSGSMFELKNKAVAAAESLQSLDPYMKVFAYYEGVSDENKLAFLAGNRIEPRASVIIEEVDDPHAKIYIRKAARKARVRLIMATDVGSSAQVDIRPFDIDPEASLAYGISDDELYQIQKEARENPSRSAFYRFAEALIGSEFKSRGEFGEITDEKLPKLFSSVPQLGSTALVAAGLTAEVVARIILGYKYPERFLVDKTRLEVVRWGEMV